MITPGPSTQLPLPLFQVLEEEVSRLREAPPQARSRWSLHVEQLLTSPTAPQRLLLTAHLSDKTQALFSQETRDLLQQDDDTQPSSEALCQALVDDLNRLLESGQSLFTLLQGFAEIPRTQETRAMLKLSLQGDDLVRLNRRLLEEAFPGAFANVSQVHQAALYQRIHQCDEPLSALCFSGGGIRSATFNLGILQGLAAHNLLSSFDYLSTVSGGGYIGSWLTSWIYRHPQGCQGVMNELKQQPTGDTAHAAAASRRQPQAALDAEPLPLRHLRNFSNYMTPQLGLLSADTWTLVATYVRNLTLNWLVLIPLLATLLAVPRFTVAFVRLQPSTFWQNVALWLGALLTMVALGYIGLSLPSVNHKPHRFSRQSGFLWCCLLPLSAAAALLTSYWAWIAALDASLTPFLIFGTLVHLGGWCPYVLRLYCAGRLVAWRVVGECLAILVAGALGGAIVWKVATAVPMFAYAQDYAVAYVCVAAPLLLGLLLLAMTIFVGLASRWTNDDDREWWARSGAWCLIAMVAWSGVSTLVVFGPLAFSSGFYTTLTSAAGIVAGLFTLMAGQSDKTPATPAQAQQGGMASLLRLGLSWVAPLFMLFLLVLLALGTTMLLYAVAPPAWIPSLSRPAPLGLFGMTTDGPFAHLKILYDTPLLLIVAVMVLLSTVGVVMGCFVNINKFSLHATYRNRLIRAYLGATQAVRRPHPFTGFDPADNIQMYELARSDVSHHRLKPIHIVNIALNLVRGGRLAWQQRKAESFTVSPLHCGSARLGYRRAGEYGGTKDGNGEHDGISLGTAVAISGAAASPNMGYHSSSAVTFLLAFFNIRLGWWLGNTSVAGTKTFRRRGPLFAVRPLIEETFGLTTNQNPYVYLSDGGHFENLGLYEMVLRRCRYIVVIDAGCDPEHEFTDLGNAIHKIRVDLGVPIDIADLPIYSRQSKKPGARCAVGSIRYSCVDGQVADGTLVYLKPAFYATDEPKDVLSYALTNPTFPHESTADQWFSESQFESYRMLGWHTLEALYRQAGQPAATPSLLADCVARAAAASKVTRQDKARDLW